MRRTEDIALSVNVLQRFHAVVYRSAVPGNDEEWHLY